MKPKLYTAFLYVCGFFLLWEWLRPVKQLTDTANLGVFIAFLFLCLALAYFNMKIIPRLVIKFLYIFYTLNYLYFEGSFFRFQWVGFLIEDFKENTGTVVQGDWIHLTPPFRSLLFFLLLALMSYLLHYWLVNRKRIFLFFFMTLLYITVLDTFTPYDAMGAIVRTVALGFALMGTLTLYRILDREKLQKHSEIVRKWLIPLAVMVGLSVIIGYAAPKASPIWPDPVPYIKSYSQGSGEGGAGGIKKVGYGVDDSQLGGPFVGDDTLVYEVETDSRQYWKVETKDLYTGKGWQVSETAQVTVPFNQNEDFPIKNYTDPDMRVVKQTGTVKPLMDYPHLIYPLGLKTVENEAGFSYQIDMNLEKIYVVNDSDLSEISEYTVEFDSPRFSISSMMSTVDANHPLLTEEFMERYTQLPENLPQRVKDLALDITEEKRTWYDKAKAVEHYFDNPQFRYDQKDVAIPEDGQDYVDQFLFETLTGYCDNFSSSMVVLMRSIGIPTRWAKGYSEGSFQGLSESRKRVYSISNNNAHSWVEVFFPEVGWVPFEPTKGYSNNAQFVYDFDATDTQEDDTLPAPQAPVTPQPESEKTETKKKVDTFSWDKVSDNILNFLNKNWHLFILGIGISVLLVYVIYRNRLKWLPYYLVLRFKGRKKDEDFPTAYLVLLNQLGRFGLKRQDGQTLREYAAYIDGYFSSKEMGALTASYERYIYRGELDKGTWKNTKELWENLIKKTIA